MANETFRRGSGKTLVIGLDGVPYTLLSQYMEKGYMPGLRKILSSGHRLHQMDASVPDVSSTSWASFITGANPAEHGIYGFMDLNPGSYGIFFPNSTDISAPTIWEILSGSAGAGRSRLSRDFSGRIAAPGRSVVMNVPQTYPAQPMNGVLTAGFVCPDLRKGTYPDAAYEYLTSIGYIPDVDAAKAAVDKDAFIEEVFASLATRRTAYEHFMKEGNWDLFICVVTETDRLHHFFFDAALDASSPYHRAFVDFYRELDRLVACLYAVFMEMTAGQGQFVTMSDHGFTAIKEEVYVNSWLREAGLLKLDRSRQYFDQVDTGTRVFAMDPARLYVNMEGKYPKGSVKNNEKAGVVAELKDMLLGLKAGCGSPVIREVFENHEVYAGPLAHKGPDLVCLANDGFDLKGILNREPVFGRTHFTGMHTSYDAHCILPDGEAPSGRLHIEMLAPVILGNFTN